MSRMISDLHADYQAARQRDADAAARREQETRAAVERDWRDERPRLIQQVTEGSVAAMRRFVTRACGFYGVRWIEDPLSPRLTGGEASTSHRRITTPELQDLDVFAVALHELGHVLSPRCEGPDHYVDPKHKDYHHCLMCEVNAWRNALEVFPFTPAMVARLTRALRSYRAQTPGTPAATAAVERLMGNIAQRQYQREGLLDAALPPALARRARQLARVGGAQ